MSFCALMSPFFQSGQATLRAHPKKYDLGIWVFMVFYLVIIKIAAYREEIKVGKGLNLIQISRSIRTKRFWHYKDRVFVTLSL